MDFPGGNLTNIHVIDGFSSIYWRIYTEEPGITNHPSEAPTNGHTILKHLSRLKDLELLLRNLGCLVSCYPRRLGLWVFSPNSNFDGLAPLNQGNDGLNRLQVGLLTLKVSASGSVSSRELVRTLSTEPQTPNVNTAGTQRSQNVPNPPRRIEGYGTSAAIYASFISAVTGAINLQLIRRHGAIPLGSRTLFTAVERDGYESRIANDRPTAIPSLSTLHIQFTSGGRLTVALQTIAQHGMSRLHSPRDDPGGICDIPPGLDIWLSPSGTVARLVSVAQNNISPNPISTWTSGSDGTSSLAAAKRTQWKQSVLEWLQKFGLPVDSHEEELWIEVEVWEPFYSRLAGELWRQNEEGPATLPLKRILWPARYCFRRTKAIALDASYGTQDACHLADSPLGLAEEWRLTGNFVHDEANTIAPSGGFQDQPMKDSEMSPSKAEFPGPMESLARIAQYPDAQSASLVYPTPPEGATAISSDAFADQPDLPLPRTQQYNEQNPQEQASSKEQADAGLTIGFGPSAGLTVGSGLYDMNGDDDLFGEMNDRDFGTRGITDADFSFFDDPELEDMKGAPATDHLQSTPNIEEANLEEDNKQLSLDVPLPVETAEGINAPQTDAAEQEAEIPLKRETSDVRMSSPREDNSQPISPPLSPVEVKKILFSGPVEGDQSAVKRERKQSHYNPVSFKKNIDDWDQKYGAEGRFWFSAPGTSAAMDSVAPASDIPTIGLPRHSGRVAVKFDSPAKVTDEQDTLSGGVKGSLNSTSDSSSISSEDDSDDIMSERKPSPVNLTRKRKRAQSNTSGSAAQALENPLVENPQLVSANKAENSAFLGNFLSTFSDWSLLGYFTVSQNQRPPTISQKEEQIQVAQLLVDQITQSSLDHMFDEQVSLSGLDNEMYPLRNILEDTAFTDEVDRLDLKSYASLQNGALSPPTSEGLTPRQLPQRKEAAKGAISKLSPPHLRIRRGKDYLEALPPAVSFWEMFDLEPAHGPKDISAYCIHPQGTAEAADTFLERLGLLYSACNLGSHARGDMCFGRGLGSWNTELSRTSNYLFTVQSLRTLCEELGNALSSSQPSTESFVVYVINPFTHAAALADICAAFWQLFQRYATGTGKQQAGKLNELVLQIIPVSFVMSPESIVVPSQSDYLSLALEVYSRCPPKDSESNFVHCAPPVLLTESAPKAINFKLVPERLSPLQDGKSLHIACSRSLDQRWITVAWSDNTGAVQRMMSYCLRYRNSGTARAISDVRNEIWGTTQTIMGRIQARWRIIIVNTEPLGQDELDTWTNLAEQHNKTKPIPLELVILHVNATTDLSLDPPSLLIPSSVFNAQASSTPVATPGPSAASPDQYGNAPTPTSGGNAPMSAATPDVPPESESEFFLTDIRDESWGVILSHRLNSSPHLTEYRPALASGYLLRRRGPTDGDGVFATNVNLIYVQSPTSSYDILLKEILGMYHDLAILSRARGTRCVRRNTLPWHIATAVRAQELLSCVF